MMDNNKIYELVGELLLIYGNLEKTLDTTIEIYFANELGARKAGALAKILVNKISSTYSKIEIINELIDSSEIDTDSKSDWHELIKDLKELNSFRNTFAHNMYGIEDNKIIKIKKNWKEVSISVEELYKKAQRLDDRYRQLFDSVIEPDATYISKYPKLKLK